MEFAAGTESGHRRAGRRSSLAAQNPTKLAELQKLWDEQAWKNNAYPLYDDLTARIAKQFKGKVDIKFNFVKTGMLKGVGELHVNGKKVAERAIEKTVPGTFSFSESFDVGIDNGTPVSNNYKVENHFPFTGQIDKVVINLIPDPT